MFEGQPKGLWALALANTGERFGYYTMLAVFILFLQANFGWTSGTAGTVYSSFLACVYFLPIIGGAAADKWGYSKMVTIGIFVINCLNRINNQHIRPLLLDTAENITQIRLRQN